ncbi:MAG: CaiB/BaiF CoA transferase family protein, partial [Tepidiformaceae bacterium]
RERAGFLDGEDAAGGTFHEHVYPMVSERAAVKVGVGFRIVRRTAHRGNRMVGAFAGLRILDFTQGIAGPMACMILSDFEPDVIKVEPPGGDRMKEHPGYLAWNRNKRRVTLDLHTYEGLHAAKELIATADVAVFDALPGELERLGLDGATLTAKHPALLHTWMPPYGEEGRWSQLPPDDMLLSAVTGISFMQFSRADVPVYLVSPQASYGQGMLGATAIATALYERQRSGLGQSLVVSGLDGVADIEAGGAIRAEGVMRFGGDPRGGIPYYRLYRCSDGLWLFLGTLTQPFFLKALEAVDCMDLMAHPEIGGDFTTLQLPPGRDIAIERLNERFAEKTRDEWLKILYDNGVPRGPAGIREKWFDSETVAENEMRVVLGHPELGPVELPGVPVKLPETPGSVRHHTLDVKVEAIEPHVPTVGGVGAGGPAAKGALDGIRILDIASFIAGTYAPAILSNYGADVIKVEALEGDAFRAFGLGFIAYNRGKRGLSINLKDPRGLELFYEMVQQADVVLDNYRLGVRERLKVDYESLRKVNPRIITCSVTAYGPVGPYSTDPGFDPILQARSGMMAAQGGVTGPGVGEPVFHQIAVNDTATATMAAFGVVAALYAREITGRGQDVQTSLANQSVLCQSGELTWYEGRPASPLGGEDCVGVGALRRFYECADGWVAFAASKPEHFHAVAVAMGHPEWAGRYTAETALAESRDGALAGAIAEAALGLTREDAVDRLLTRGVPAAPALRIEEVMDGPFMRQNGFFEEYTHPQWGKVEGARRLGRWSRTPGAYRYPAPLIGEHSVELLREFGFEQERIDGLLAGGVVLQA